ncbi:MAG TPA: acyltransferase domain-containing protein, partial [Candidatus Ozemobacteraceae bacterium]|nr:acyltransferase domain-containing protein [Candidatus Ozemobacteraceae bacterium]
MKLAFIFSGMGQQWSGMGKRLFDREPVFRRVIEECSHLFSRHTTAWNLQKELLAGEDESRIHETQIAQPCIFAVQAALSTLLQSWGIIPDVIVGHSVGEVAGYVSAGILSLPDAVKVCFHRSRLQQTKAGSGGMLAVGLSEIAIAGYLEGFQERVSIAAVNSSDALTLAGDIQPLEEIAQKLEREQIFHRFLHVEVPYHSPCMDSIRDELRESLRDIQPVKGKVPVISTVTGEEISGTLIHGDYWAENARKPVLFALAVQELIKRETDVFVELGAHPVLSGYIRESISLAGKTGVVTHSLKRR